LVTAEVILACIGMFAVVVGACLVTIRVISRLLYGPWVTGPPVVLGALAMMATSPLGWFDPGWLVGTAMLVLPLAKRVIRMTGRLLGGVSVPPRSPDARADLPRPTTGRSPDRD
jgi:hypothetical protein